MPEEQSGVPALRFGVLGPVRAWRGQEALATGSPQQRALLAMLLLHRGGTVTGAELIEALWGHTPPSQALAAVRTYVSRLRKTLGPGLLVSDAGGYAIRVAGDALDLSRAEECVRQAEKQRASGLVGQARAHVEAALGLWEGEPLAGVPGPYARTERARLEEWRLQLLESRLGMELDEGRHAEVVSELTALAAEYPLRERLRELLMLALYRSGRQAEALAVFADTRRMLADELGVDPGSGLQTLQRSILQADPALAHSRTPGADSSAALVRPAQLPGTIPDFTGRTESVAQLTELLSATGGWSRIAVAGTGGVGKTTLAVHVAHAARAAFPDGQLYVDLQGTGARPAEPETVLRAFLRALGTPEHLIPDTLAEQAALYRSVLDDRRVLVLLDNARDAAQIRPLLPGSEGCAALVTSRVRMVDLAGAHLVDLDVMAPDEALRLFTGIVGAERVAAEREAALEVVAACGYLPLALRIAASRLAARRTWTVKMLAGKLADARRRLDELRAGDLAVEATFERAYGRLEPAQQRAFRLLGLADGPDISLSAAAALLDLPRHRAEQVIEPLVDTSLLESAAPERYRFHDLIRIYARNCAERDEPPQSRASALSGLLDFYLATAAAVHAVERPGDRLVHHLSPTRHTGPAFPDRDSALDWLFAEAECLLAGVGQSACPAEPEHATGPVLDLAADLLMATVDLAASGTSSRSYETAARAVADAAYRAGELRAEGRARVCLAAALGMAGHLEAAETEAVRALQAGTETADVLVRAHAAARCGTLALAAERHAAALQYTEQAVAEFRADHNAPGEAAALCHLSSVCCGLGDAERAVELALHGVRIHERTGAGLPLGNGKYALGLALIAAGRPDEAVAHLAHARDLFRTSRQPLWEGMADCRLAEAHLAAGRPARAAEHAEQALGLEGPGGGWRRGTMLTLLGRALHGTGQTVRAEACWAEALSLYESCDRSFSPAAGEVRTLLASRATA